jgi:hypothetical protein
MIWTLKVGCVFGAGHQCVRVIEIDSGATLADLGHAIREAAGFAKARKSQFVAGRSETHANRIVHNEGEEMEAARLENAWPTEKGHALFYIFGFGGGGQHRFKISRGRWKPKEPEEGVRYPRVIKRVGDDLGGAGKAS